MWLPLVLCAAGLGPAALQPPQEAPPRQSLEQFLRTARREREALHARLAVEVQRCLTQLRELPRNPPVAAFESAIEGLASLGADATPLLLPHLAVPSGEGAAPEQRREAEVQADRVAEALRRMPCDPIRGELLELAQHGTLRTQTRALRVLQTSSAREQVRPPILALFESSEGELADAALATLIAIGGDEGSTFLTEQLARPEPELVDRALLELAERRDEQALPAVRELLADPLVASQHSHSLLEYFKALPDRVRFEDTLNFVHLAAGSAPRSTRLEILAALPDFDPTLNHDLRTAIKPLLGERDKELREAALIALATVGDRASRKELLAEYDGTIERNERWSRGYSQRAWILLRIGQNDDAIKDFRKALEYGKDSQKLQPEIYLGLARAHARKGKLRDAAEWLRKAPISLADLQALETDEDFLELRASKWGKEAFGR